MKNLALFISAATCALMLSACAHGDKDADDAATSLAETADAAADGVADAASDVASAANEAADVVEADVATAVDSCNSAEYAGTVGANIATLSFPAGKKVRLTYDDSPASEVDMERVTFKLTNAGEIVSVTCG